jgi:hypothetical protein
MKNTLDNRARKAYKKWNKERKAKIKVKKRIQSKHLKTVQQGMSIKQKWQNYYLQLTSEEKQG